MEGPVSSAWMITEQYVNWLADKQHDFVHLGIPEWRRKSAGRIQSGDLLFIYVSSGVSAFAGIREAVQSGVRTSRIAQTELYVGQYPFLISTRPLLTLDEKDWIPIRELTPLLSFTRKHRDWRQVLRNPIRLLEPEDRDTLARAFSPFGFAETIT